MCFTTIKAGKRKSETKEEGELSGHGEGIEKRKRKGRHQSKRKNEQ
jgi:hypothetical protein